MSEATDNPPQPIGNPPLNQATLTSHLKNFNPPEQTEEEISAENLAGELKDFKLPKTLKATHDLLNSLLASTPADPEEGKVKTAKVEMIMAHLGKLGQGAQPAPISFAERKAINNAQSDQADLLKIQVLSRTHPEVRVLSEKLAAALAWQSAVIDALSTAKDLTVLKKTISDLDETK